MHKTHVGIIPDMRFFLTDIERKPKEKLLPGQKNEQEFKVCRNGKAT